MSSKDNDEQNQSSDAADDAAFSEVDVAATEEEFEVEPLTAAKSKRSSGMVSWLALILAGLALGAVGFNYVRDQSALGDVATGVTDLRTLTESLAATQNTLATLERNVASLEAETDNANATAERQFESIGAELNSRLRLLEAVPGRLSGVEASLASVQGISTGARDAWLLAEAEYYMQIANAQLQLANNPQLASIALSHADDRILQLADPRLTNIRAALSDELRALEVMTKPDTAGITLTLTSLAGVVESLPLQQEVVVREQSTDEIDADLSGVDRALASFKGAMSGVVSVRREDEAMQPLIAPEAQYFLRANLALQLQAARLALLRGEESIFRQSLDDADAWLTEYYDAGNSSVQNAQQTIAEIRGSTLSVAVPDISLSLRLLRQFNSLARAPRSQPEITPEAEPEPEVEPEPEAEAETDLAADPESTPGVEEEEPIE